MVPVSNMTDNVGRVPLCSISLTNTGGLGRPLECLLIMALIVAVLGQSSVTLHFGQQDW